MKWDSPTRRSNTAGRQSACLGLAALTFRVRFLALSYAGSA